jgi:hypothetical protein
MRIRMRYVTLALASVAVLGVGGLAFATPPDPNTSSVQGSKITPSTLPKTTFVPITLFTHTHTTYANPGDKPNGGYAKRVTVYYDDDGTLNLSGIPKCTATFSSGTTIATAWERCGPGADTAPEVNAYLSPASGVSGRTSTAPASNFNGCTLVFNGPTVNGNPTVLLFARVTLIPNGTANCANPASNASGNTTVTLKGTVTAAGIPDFGKKLTVPNIDQLALPLDDFTATTKRASVFKARCHDTNKILNIRGKFEYSGTGQPADIANSTQACTVG